MLLLGLAIFVALLPSSANGHGRLMDPPARNSMWRLGFANPVNYNDNELYCGGRVTQWARNKGKCGICGDPFHKNREHETGGKYANGIITRDYVEGNVIFVSILITANHQGYFEFRICPVDNPKVEVTQQCLDKHLLSLDSGDETRYYLEKGKSNHFFNYSLQLPPGLTCKHCVLQWKYRTGNTWDKDPSGKYCVGCGPQEEFVNCADVAVHESNNGPQPPVQNQKIEQKKKMLKRLAAAATQTTNKVKTEKIVKNPYLETRSEAYNAKNIPGDPVSRSIYYTPLPNSQPLKEQAKLINQRHKEDKGNVFKSSKLLENQSVNFPYQSMHSSNSQTPKDEINAVGYRKELNHNYYKNVLSMKGFTPSSLFKQKSKASANKISSFKGELKGRLELSRLRNIPPTSAYLRQARIQKYHKIQNSPRANTNYNSRPQEGKYENKRAMFHHGVAKNKLSTSGVEQYRRLANHWKNLGLNQMTAIANTYKSTVSSTPMPKNSIKRLSPARALGRQPGLSQGIKSPFFPSYNKSFFFKKHKTSPNEILHGKGDHGQSSIRDTSRSISRDFPSNVWDNGYTDVKKTHVHQKLPYWLIKALRMRPGKNMKSKHRKSPVSRNLKENPKTGASQKSDNNPYKSFIQTSRRQKPRGISVSSLSKKPKTRNIPIHDVTVGKTAQSNERQVDKGAIMGNAMLDSSEEESLIRKIVHFILKRRKSQRTSKTRGSLSGNPPEILESSRGFLDRSIHETRSKSSPRGVLASTPAGHHADRYGSQSSPDYGVYSSVGRQLISSQGKFHHAPKQQESDDKHLNLNSPEIHWLRTIPNARNEGSFGNEQNELYLKTPQQSGPKAVPFSNLQSLKSKNYVPIDTDVLFSQSYSNPNKMVNHPVDVSNIHDMNNQRQAEYQQQQNSHTHRQEHNLDKFVSQQFIQNPQLLWALRVHQRQRYPLQKKKQMFVCKAVVRLGGGMDQWCNDNCNANFCPSSMCICRVEEPTLFPVITSFASNPAGIIGGVNGVAWVPLGKENPILTQAEAGSSPFLPQTSVYRNANALSKNNHLTSNVGYKFKDFHNDHTFQRYSRPSDIVSYYPALSRPTSPRINYSFAPKNFANHEIDTQFHRKIPKTIEPRPRSTEFPLAFDRNSIKLAMDQRQKMNQGSKNQEVANFYIPGPSSHPRLFSVDDYFLQNEVVYHKNRKNNAFYGQNRIGAF